jgi:TetR/AcrR family transcriptional repressor of nem operon
MKDKEAAILKVTEDMIRDGGYNSFSFRNIADAVGIKSSSVHYHFATKEDLVVAVTKHYTDAFLAALGEPEELRARGQKPIEVYVAAFRCALIADNRLCLCGILGAEMEVLPKRVSKEVKSFFQRNIKWLSRSFEVGSDKKLSNEKAIQALALLEGAMITANAMGDIGVFDSASRALLL